MLACAILLFRGYIFARKRMLLWSAICFAALAISDVMVFVDLILVPDIDLYFWRVLLRAAGLASLLYGLIWDSH
jgi:uncharacterized membrane protein